MIGLIRQVFGSAEVTATPLCNSGQFTRYRLPQGQNIGVISRKLFSRAKLLKVLDICWLFRSFSYLNLGPNK